MARTGPSEEQMAWANSMGTSGFWFYEANTETSNVAFKMSKIYVDTKSKFQACQIIETLDHGKTLVLDGKTQSAANDEKVYHESLVHPAMMLHPNPKNVYIGGGGEGATMREVLRHKSVEKCVMVDIDEEVCKLCEEHMPEWADGAWTDPRAEYHYEDAHAFIKADERMYDVIIMDIADPIEAGPGICLYTEEFYKFAATRLSPGGVLVTQSSPGGICNSHECFSTIYQTLRTAFDVVVPYTADVPSFGSNWGFNLAFNLPGNDHRVATGFEATGEDRAAKSAEAGVAAQEAVTRKPSEQVDALIEERITGGEAALAFLDGVSWHGLFGVPKQVRKTLKEEKRIMSVANPVFMY